MVYSVFDAALAPSLIFEQKWPEHCGSPSWPLPGWKFACIGHTSHAIEKKFGLGTKKSTCVLVVCRIMGPGCGQELVVWRILYGRRGRQPLSMAQMVSALVLKKNENFQDAFLDEQRIARNFIDNETIRHQSISVNGGPTNRHSCILWLQEHKGCNSVGKPLTRKMGVIFFFDVVAYKLANIFSGRCIKKGASTHGVKRSVEASRPIWDVDVSNGDLICT